MRIAAIVVALVLSGCAQEPPGPVVQSVSIVGSDFCAIMKRTLPPSGKPSWDIADTPQTRTDARKIGRAVDQRCGTPKP